MIPVLRHWSIWANQTLVTTELSETKDKAQGCPKMGMK